jgi:predicted DNA-binding protein
MKKDENKKNYLLRLPQKIYDDLVLTSDGRPLSYIIRMLLEDYIKSKKGK